ncbi:hypothetical protein D3C75_1034690 [compost metagenome]
MPGLSQGQTLADEAVARIILVEPYPTAPHAIVEGLDEDRQGSGPLDAERLGQEAEAPHVGQPGDFISRRRAVQPGCGGSTGETGSPDVMHDAELSSRRMATPRHGYVAALDALLGMCRSTLRRRRSGQAFSAPQDDGRRVSRRTRFKKNGGRA